MHDATVTAAKGSSDLTVVVVGHSAAKLPRLVEREAARLAKGQIGAQNLVAEDGRYLLLKPDDKAWLIGGENWRLIGCQVAEAVRAAHGKSATVLVQGAGADVQAMVEGVLLGDYRYNVSRSGKEGTRTAITVRFPGHQRAVEDGERIARCQNLARELADSPGNVINPQTFVARARQELKGLGLDVRVTSGVDALRRARFPGLVQVGMAGSAPPALLEIRHTPRKAKKSKHRLALVGKGITFDSGGISLKPGAKMWEMKGDMGGAAAVLAAMKAIAELKVDVPVTGYIALAENMPDSRAQRPGDIYQARNGKWIHVDNTDAEGRLVLADVLTYACEQGATHLVDLATLTGAVLVALGDKVAGLMGRHEAWLQKVRQAGLEVGEEYWPLPLYGEYRSLIDHPHADINNTGGPYGGSITAGIFLSEFVSDHVHWAHCDIAGAAIQAGGWRYFAKGMTGFGTRMLVRLASRL
ncbi:MAG TPA: leucyl aminopeptidase family protein [Planctomycetota bacterium]|nr:leucyl aminopeptidase family protein [Planctomycetota bacterium]